MRRRQMSDLAHEAEARTAHASATSDDRSREGVPQGVQAAICSEAERDHTRNRDKGYNVIEQPGLDGEPARRELQTGSIDWAPRRDDSKALFALRKFGWDRQRVVSELTMALGERGGDFVRDLLRDLVLQARMEHELQHDVGQANSEAFREELRLASGCPLCRLKLRLAAKARFVREMLGPVPSTEDALDRRRLDPVPNWLALEVATQTLTKPREFLLWDPSGISFFSAISADGSRRSGTFALLDRGDRVEVYTCGGASQPDFTVDVSWDGCLMMPASPNPIYAVLPRGGVPEILWEDYGLDFYELYFGRVDRIQYDPVWPPAWLAAVEDRLCDMAAESDGHDDSYDWEPWS